jgi:hypothetical protein
MTYFIKDKIMGFFILHGIDAVFFMTVYGKLARTQRGYGKI